MNSPLGELQPVILSYLDGRLPPEEVARLSERLRDDAAARALYLHLADLHSNLAVNEALWLVARPAERKEDRRPEVSGGWKRLIRHFMAPLGVGLVVGIICTSVVWGRVNAKAAPQPLRLADADFELGVEPRAEGVPSEFGAWSGDYARCVGAEQGIAPAHGGRMLRFLRPDNKLTPPGAGSSVAEVWYLADFRSWAGQTGGLPATIEAAASFNAVPGNADRRYAFGLAVYAFRGAPRSAPALWKEKLDAALASGDREELADSNPDAWQRVATRAIVPPDAELLLIQLRVTPKLLPPGEVPDFRGHYADHLTLHLVRDGRD